MNVNKPPLSVEDLLRLARAGDANALKKLARMAEQGAEKQAEKRAEKQIEYYMASYKC